MDSDIAQEFSRPMTNIEIEALFLCREEILLTIDPLLTASSLRSNNNAIGDIYTIVLDLIQDGHERDHVSEVLISNLPLSVDLRSFVTVLDECGYKTLAARVFLTFLKLNANTEVTRNVSKSRSGQRPTLGKQIVNIKRMVDDAQFKDPRLALSQLSERFIKKMYAESDQTKKQLLADKCIAMLGAEIDAIAITFDTGLRNRDVFSKMKSIISYTSNTYLTDGVYFGRLANANAIAGKFEDSENMLQAARCKAYHIGPCFELLFMLVIEVQVRLYTFEKSPTREQRQALLMWGRVGLECSEQEDLDVKKMWRRSFILRMVFCLIGLGNRANVIENCPVDDTCIAEAKDLLADIDRNWYGIETRRKMFYYVARARIGELTHRYNDCLDNLRVAMHLAYEGHFDELIFITAYFNRIDGQHNSAEYTGDANAGQQSKTEEISSANACRIEAINESRTFIVVSLPPFLEGVTFSYDILGHDDEISRKQFLYSPIATNREMNIALLQQNSLLKPSSNTSTDENEASQCIIEIKDEISAPNVFDESEEADKFVLMRQTSDGTLKSLEGKGKTARDARESHNIAILRVQSSESVIAGYDKVNFDNIDNNSEMLVMFNLKRRADKGKYCEKGDNVLHEPDRKDYSQQNMNSCIVENLDQSNAFVRLQSPNQSDLIYTGNAEMNASFIETPTYHGSTNKFMTISVPELLERAPISGRSSAGNTGLSDRETVSEDDSFTYLKTAVVDNEVIQGQNIELGSTHIHVESKNVTSINLQPEHCSEIVSNPSNEQERNCTLELQLYCNPSTTESRIPPLGRDSAGNTPYTSKSLEHLNAEQSFDNDNDDEHTSLASDDLFGD